MSPAQKWLREYCNQCGGYFSDRDGDVGCLNGRHDCAYADFHILPEDRQVSESQIDTEIYKHNADRRVFYKHCGYDNEEKHPGWPERLAPTLGPEFETEILL
jgi:predicted  nucleic acid-binding Zn-ribbon protein